MLRTHLVAALAVLAPCLSLLDHAASSAALPAASPVASPVASPASPSAASTAAPSTADRRHRTLSLGRRVEFGAFVAGMQADPSLLDGYEALLGHDAAVASYYYGYGDVFPGPAETTFADGGKRRVLVAWDMGPTRFTDWSSGAQDDYLDAIAKAARAYPDKLYVRPWPEMNGDWQQFQPTANGRRPYGGTYAEFRAAWRYVVTYLRRHGADNLRWVFNPTADTYPETTPVRRIWPGARYVDVLGLDGYNWGNSADGLRWRSFDDIFRRQYRNLVRLDRRAPVWICETGSKEPTVDDGAPVDRRHSKRAWVTRMLATRTMSRVTTVVWFDAAKERDWRVNSSPGALAAMRRGLS